ncbi:hypothetical protein J2W34_001832 [Variovorax boronicumulans]|nr:hypothetical protein [Variovorax boronicumulans]
MDSAWDIKFRYPEVLSGQDFLRLLIEYRSDPDHQRRMNAIKAFLAGQYYEEQDVKFKQVELQNKLLDLFVDLPFQLGRGVYRENEMWKRRSASLPYEIIDRDEDSEDDLETSPATAKGTASLILLHGAHPKFHQMVIEGAPGQGKSTLAQYLCQVHRIKLLNKNLDYEQLPKSHQLAPISIPVKVDLRDLAEWLDGSDPFVAADQVSRESFERSVETFLARLISHRAGGFAFEVSDLVAVAQSMPLFVAFDGLDEVADIRRRAEVVSQVTKSLSRLKENCPKLHAIVTSRPAAFANSPGFDPKLFTYLQLGSVRRKQIDLYAKKWMDARTLSLKERAEFEAILKEKLELPHLRDLSRNPMQLTILLSLIHTKGAALPDKRTSLYDAYVELFFSRESTKNSIVRKHLELLKDIHRYLAWVLHSRAESGRGAGADGRFSSDELKNILMQYLTQERQSTAIIEEIFNAMLERVVMIVSRIEGTHEFEVQPLREYFAARYLYDTAPYSPAGKERMGTKPDRFDAMAANRYWLNVVRFFCGCFSKGELLDLADRVKELISHSQYGKVRHPYVLAAMLLSDSVFAQSPKSVQLLTDLLTTPAGLLRLSPAVIAYRNDEPMRLAINDHATEEKIFNYFFSLGARSNLQMLLAQFIKANVPASNINARWMALRHSDLELDVWLRTGQYLGALKGLDESQLKDLLQKEVLTRSSISTLWRSGHGDVIATTANTMNAAREFFLSEFVSWSKQAEVSAPLYLFPAISRLVALPHMHADANDPDFLGDFVDLAESFSLNNKSIPLDQSDGENQEFSAQCYRLSAEMASICLDRESKNGAVGIWQRMVDVVYKEFGLKVLVIGMALGIAKSQGRPVARKCELLDGSVSLVDRIVYAGRNGDRWAYWERALDEEKSTEERIFFLITLVLQTSSQFLLENAVELEEFIGKLSASEWRSFLDALSEVSQFKSTRGKGVKKISGLEVDFCSARFAYLMAWKDPVQFSKKAFFDYFVESDSNFSHSTINGFRQRMAFSCASNNEMPWAKALEIMPANPDYLGYFQSIAKIPDEVADLVIGSPADYPLSLWEGLQSKLTDSLSKKIKPVAAIAKKENGSWPDWLCFCKKTPDIEISKFCAARTT